MSCPECSFAKCSGTVDATRKPRVRKIHKFLMSRAPHLGIMKLGHVSQLCHAIFMLGHFVPVLFLQESATLNTVKPERVMKATA